MKLISLIDEDFVNYKSAAMYLIFPTCSFKCNTDCGQPVCQNFSIINNSTVDITKEALCERYLANSITTAIVCAGLEPLDSPLDLVPFVDCLRNKYHCDDPIIIYTGYTEAECEGVDEYTYPKAIIAQTVLVNEYQQLKNYKNIIVKFGRFIPNDTPHFDPVLGITLVSSNQYAKVISNE